MSRDHAELSAWENLYESQKEFYVALMGLNSDEELNDFDMEFLEKLTNNEFNN
jgi:hypothetical protein